MKVVGTGTPRTLTVRVQSCEISLWREALRRRMSTPPDRALRLTQTADDVERFDRDEASTLARLLDRAHAAVPSGQPWVLTGPSWLLSDLIRGITEAAVDRYVQAWHTFEESRDIASADRLRVALDAASACTATSIALARVQNDATD